MRRGRLPQQQGRAHRGHAHQSLCRARRTPVHAGARLRLLAGTLREELLDLPRAAASEAILTPQDLLAADRLYLGNSVRGLASRRADRRRPRGRRAACICPRNRGVINGPALPLGAHERFRARGEGQAAKRRPRKEPLTLPAMRLAQPSPRKVAAESPLPQGERGSRACPCVLGSLVALLARDRGCAIGIGLRLEPACGLAERGPELDPGPRQSFADILGALAQRLGTLPHLACGLG